MTEPFTAAEAGLDIALVTYKRMVKHAPRLLRAEATCQSMVRTSRRTASVAAP